MLTPALSLAQNQFAEYHRAGIKLVLHPDNSMWQTNANNSNNIEVQRQIQYKKGFTSSLLPAKGAIYSVYFQLMQFSPLLIYTCTLYHLHSYVTQFTRVCNFS